jgi:hypothetical protein
VRGAPPSAALTAAPWSTGPNADPLAARGAPRVGRTARGRGRRRGAVRRGVGRRGAACGARCIAPSSGAAACAASGSRYANAAVRHP